MASFITIQENDELERAAKSLTLAPFWHRRVGDVRIANPFRERKQAWETIRATLRTSRTDAVLVSMFLERDLLTAAYLLAPLRGYEAMNAPSTIRIALVLPKDSPFNATTLKGEVAVVSLPELQLKGKGCAQLRERLFEVLSPDADGDILIVEDQPGVRGNLKQEMRMGWFGGKQVHILEFDKAHDLLLTGAKPAAIVTDLIEVVNRPQYDHTGLGLYLIARSTPRLHGTVPVLYSTRTLTNPNDPCPGTLRAFDEVFIQDAMLEARLDAFLKQV